MIVTNDPAIFKFCKEYHDHGHESNSAFPRGRDTRTMAGMNYRMNEMQGAVGMAQLEKLETIIAKNRENKEFIISRMNKGKISFRKLTDPEGDLSDTIIFNFENEVLANKFVELYKLAGYGTKNIPDAIDWHFAGTWNHMFADVPAYKDSWKTTWKRSADLLYRSVALPVNVKTTPEELAKHVEAINKIMTQI
jgi:8-amino-3,8-dideoxy-alpha-D-manno-octulosonate transaminase